MANQHIALIKDTGRDLLGPDSSSNIWVCLAITGQKVTDHPIERI